MKIKFLGTSNANPRPDRAQTCIYVECEGKGHVVDCGDGAATQLWLDPAIDWGCLRALLISHFHADHVGGAFCFLHLLKGLAKENPAWPIHREEDFRFCLPTGKPGRKVTGVLPALHLDRETLSYNMNYEFYTPGIPFQAGALEVTPMPTSHCEEAHGFTLKGGGRTVVYSGDLGEPQDITEHPEGADLVICECAHFHPKELVPELLSLKAGHYVITHLHDRLMDNPEKTRAYFEPLQDKAKLTLATDGLAIELD